MPYRLLLLLIPLAEIAAFIVVGGAIGVFPTLLLVLLGFIAGGMLLRRQGIETLRRVRADVAGRQLPGRTVAEGMLKALAALLLIVPGFVTDIVGLLLLLPPVRAALWRAVERRVIVRTTGDIRARPRPAVIDLDNNEFGARPGGVLPEDRRQR